MTSPRVYTPTASGAVPGAEEIGGKASALLALTRIASRPEAGFSVPPWVVIPASTLAGEGSAAELLEDLRDAMASAGITGDRVAARSSAAVEDGAQSSYAGQFESVLNVDAKDDTALVLAIERVRASGRSRRAAAYGALRGEAQADRVPLAVVVQEMADPSVAGVAFTADPVRGDRDVVVVSAVEGLGESLVSGERDADTWRVDDGSGLPRVIEERPAGSRPVATAAEVIEIARCARRIEASFGCPQDIEWALERRDGSSRLVILQSRPITTLSAAAAGGARRIWDNSNIVESYAGVTTPLTFSFARSVYEDVYRQFCELMGVPRGAIERHREVFASMLGLIRGRVYYNLLNWYRTLALLPGFALNREFMETMMGVRERLEGTIEAPSGGKAADALRLLRTMLRMTIAAFRLGRDVPAFHRRVHAALDPLADPDLTLRSAEDLVALYRRLEDDLLRHWHAPLVNDFFAMIAFGSTKRLLGRWLPSAPPTLINDLLAGEGGIISTEPARAVMSMAREVAQDQALREVFDAHDGRPLWDRLHGSPAFAAFAATLDAYVRRFGDRCMNELKLETLTLRDDPSFLLRTIRSYAEQGAVDATASREREERIRHEAERAVREGLSLLRRRLFFAMLRRARARVRDRENLRFERTRVFGVVRRIFVALGEHLRRAGLLDDRRDVFWLTVDEVFGAVAGTGVSTELKGLVRLRRSEFDAYAREAPPPDRFETHGVPLVTAATTRQDNVTDGAGWRGTGCCPGVVRAPVTVVRDPSEPIDLKGRILVAERTDPGWTLLFPAALGLLVERGSLLSHSAIVARELGLPCVVGVPGLLAGLEDGEVVEMDGTTGLIRRAAEGV